jgi:hypothetical protein
MKKIIKLSFAVLFIGFVFNSCKKSSNPPPLTSSMTFSFNGTNQTFNTCFALVPTMTASSQVLITGYNITGGAASNNSFSIQIVHDISTLQAGQTYPAAASTAAANSSSFVFFTDASHDFITQTANPQGTVMITGVSSSTITGTFSGDLFAPNDTNGSTVIYTITNGVFTASRY